MTEQATSAPAVDPRERGPYRVTRKCVWPMGYHRDPGDGAIMLNANNQIVTSSRMWDPEVHQEPLYFNVRPEDVPHHFVHEDPEIQARREEHFKALAEEKRRRKLDAERERLRNSESAITAEIIGERLSDALSGLQISLPPEVMAALGLAAGPAPGAPAGQTESGASGESPDSGSAGGSGSGSEYKALEDMTKAELIAFAKENNLELPPNANKDEIFEVIVASLPDRE